MPSVLVTELRRCSSPPAISATPTLLISAPIVCTSHLSRFFPVIASKLRMFTIGHSPVTNQNAPCTNAVRRIRPSDSSGRPAVPASESSGGGLPRCDPDRHRQRVRPAQRHVPPAWREVEKVTCDERRGLH